MNVKIESLADSFQVVVKGELNSKIIYGTYKNEEIARREAGILLQSLSYADLRGRMNGSLQN